LKVLAVFGTRPEVIKLAPVIRELRKYPDRVMCKVCVTAQHRQMLDQMLQVFQIQPDYDLNIMQDNQSPSYVAARVLMELEGVIQREKPDWVLIQGDTTTVAAAALAAYYAGVKVAHVEAGLRTGDKWRPFPEEINRRVVGAIADLHFAPTALARANLLREGVAPEAVVVTGNPVIDALRWIAAQPPSPAAVELLARAGVPSGQRLVLVTAHRRESFGVGILALCQALAELAERFPELTILYPVHPNPNVHRPVHQILGRIPNIMLTEPLDYAILVHIMTQAVLVLTDSGGIQEEAPSLGKPVLVLREVTERPEAIQAGTARLVGTDPQRIVSETVRLLTDPAEYNRMARAVNPYGDGRAAERIVSALLGEPFQPFEPENVAKEVEFCC
jgi:UDP-N-acetylglucosamine 2-epimerase (non-hydrolysing)